MATARILRIKAAQHQLIALCGGIDDCVEVGNFGRSTVGRWYDLGDPTLMPLNAVIALEAHCGQPIVTAALAEINGRRLAAPDGEAASQISVMNHHAEAIVHAGELMSAGAAVYSTRAGLRLQRDEAVRRDAAETASERLSAYISFLTATTHLYGACWELGQALRPSSREPEHCTARYAIYEDRWDAYVGTKISAIFSAAAARDAEIETAISSALAKTTELCNIVSARYHDLKRGDWPPVGSGLPGLDDAADNCHKALEALDMELVRAARELPKP